MEPINRRNLLKKAAAVAGGGAILVAGASARAAEETPKTNASGNHQLGLNITAKDEFNADVIEFVNTGR